MSAPEYLAWFEKAEHDLLSISNNLASATVPWDKVTFDAQQAAEKYLKGLMVYHGRRPPRTHDLEELLAFCTDYSQGLASLKADCRRLTRLGAVSRYPDVPGEPTGPDARQAVQIAHRVRDAIRDCVAADPPRADS